MRRTIKISLSILLALLLILLLLTPVFAKDNYVVIIDDREDLLTEQEELSLRTKMENITQWGNAAFVTCFNYSRETSAYAKEVYRSLFGTSSGTLFMIDMGQRNIWIFSDGAVYRVVTKAYANTITDNIYKLAGQEKYYECAYEAFDQIETLLIGGKISQPMKYISNVLTAIILALVINFFILRMQRREPSDQFDFESTYQPMTSLLGIAVIAKEVLSSKRSRHVESSGGSGGGGGGGGFSGGGGGGSSGGGVGHSF